MSSEISHATLARSQSAPGTVSSENVTALKNNRFTGTKNLMSVEDDDNQTKIENLRPSLAPPKKLFAAVEGKQLLYEVANKLGFGRDDQEDFTEKLDTPNQDKGDGKQIKGNKDGGTPKTIPKSSTPGLPENSLVEMMTQIAMISVLADSSIARQQADMGVGDASQAYTDSLQAASSNKQASLDTADGDKAAGIASMISGGLGMASAGNMGLSQAVSQVGSGVSSYIKSKYSTEAAGQSYAGAVHAASAQLLNSLSSNQNTNAQTTRDYYMAVIQTLQFIQTNTTQTEQGIRFV